MQQQASSTVDSGVCVRCVHFDRVAGSWTKPAKVDSVHLLLSILCSAVH